MYRKNEPTLLGTEHKSTCTFTMHFATQSVVVLFTHTLIHRKVPRRISVYPLRVPEHVAEGSCMGVFNVLNYSSIFVIF